MWIVEKLGYKKGEKLVFNSQRTCGVWLIYIGLIILAATIAGGELLINPIIFGFGYFIGFIFIIVMPYVNRKLAYGKNSKFQDNMDNISILLNIILCTACGMIIGFEDVRTLWLSILIVVGIHFFGFYFSHGKWVIVLGILTLINGIAGLILLQVPFIIFGIVDSLIKLVIGIRMFFLKKFQSAF